MKTKKTNSAVGYRRSAEGAPSDTLTGLLKEDQSWSAKRKKRDELAEGIRQLEQIVFKSENDLRTELSVFNYQWNEKRTKASNLSDYEKEFEYISRQYHKLKKLQEQINQITESGLSEKVQLEHWHQQMESLKTEIAGENQKEIDRCPVCELPLDKEQQSKFRANLEKSDAGRKKQMEELKQRTAAHENKIQELRAAYVEVEKEVKEMGDVQKMLANIEHRLSEAKSAEHESLALKDDMEKIKQKLAHRTFAKRELQAIEDLEKLIKENGYDEIRHEEVKSRIWNLVEKEVRN